MLQRSMLGADLSRVSTLVSFLVTGACKLLRPTLKIKTESSIVRAKLWGIAVGLGQAYDTSQFSLDFRLQFKGNLILQPHWGCHFESCLTSFFDMK